MTQEAFKSQLQRLKNQWPSAYGDERTKVLFHAVKSLPDWWMESSVNHFLKEFATAPLPRHFIERADEYEEERKNKFALAGKADDFPPTDCPSCSGSGYSTTRDEKLRYSYLCRCNCSAGNRRPAVLLAPKGADGLREEIVIPQLGARK